LDLFKLINNSKNIKIIGVRPDEKIHERLISESEIDRIALFEGNYVVIPPNAFWGNEIIDFYKDKMIKVFESQFISESASKLSDTEMMLMIKKEIERLNEIKS